MAARSASSTGALLPSRRAHTRPPLVPFSSSMSARSACVAERTASTTGWCVAGRGLGLLQLVDLVEDRLAPSVGGLVRAHCIELAVGQALESRNDLGCRQAVVVGNRQRGRDLTVVLRPCGR